MVQPDAEVVTKSLFKACSDSLQVGLNCADRPPLLYHFTSAEGLLGILSEGGIWASLATSLDDKFEIRYATELAKEHLSQTARAAPADRGFRQAMLSNLDSIVASVYGTFSAECYITSFCPDESSELHWSGYGRKGRGYALGFDAKKLRTAPFDLAPILYDKKEQIGAIELLCRAAMNAAAKLSQGWPPEIVREISEASAHIAATHFSLLAPRIKDPTLFEEAEWRLVTCELFHNGERLQEGDIELGQGFSSANGTDVPHVVNNFAGQGLPITELLVGPTAATVLRGVSLQANLNRAGLNDVSIRIRP